MGRIEDRLADCVGFEWDEANVEKNWKAHGVTPSEAEDVFFHDPLLIRSDVQHSQREKRYYSLGESAAGRRLFVAFTIRKRHVRVISVRDMNDRETEAYEKFEKRSS